MTTVRSRPLGSELTTLDLVIVAPRPAARIRRRARAAEHRAAGVVLHRAKSPAVPAPSVGDAAPAR
jgi:hypothetical protein